MVKKGKSIRGEGVRKGSLVKREEVREIHLKKKKKNSVSFSYFKKGGAESSLKGLSKIWLCNVSLSRGLLFPATLDVHLLSIWVFQVGLPIVIMD